MAVGKFVYYYIILILVESIFGVYWWRRGLKETPKVIYPSPVTASRSLFILDHIIIIFITIIIMWICRDN